MYIEKLASQIRNDVVSGLRGYHQNLSMNIDQLQDEIVACRLSIINELHSKGIAPIDDLLMAINCVDVDCESLERCSCGKKSDGDTITAHFQIPQLVTTYGTQAIKYLGATDRQNKFTIVTSLSELQTIKYRRRGLNKPYVWIDLAPNADGMLDCFLFNAPFVRQVSIVAVFKDPRQLNKYKCCNLDDLNGPDVNNSFIDQLIKDKLTKEKLYYYRLAAAPKLPNDQQYTSGN